ncbi:fumarylacetoacetate hydrolase family protein [Pendulispora brunnea]|uniref:Fumarylacetoacetate hydrolase family protein n=1 Tax=Pendulispora brunnea TaxID=2905690 RepID=A0ABZ2KLC0_9BACT
MRIASLVTNGRPFLGVRAPTGDAFVDVSSLLESAPRDLGAFLRTSKAEREMLERVVRDARELETRARVAVKDVTYRPLLGGGKVLCLGLNYVDHANESPYEPPKYPVLFARFATSFVGHEQPIVRPSLSTHFDYEAELVVFIGRTGRNIPRDRALEHVAGYSLMNDGSIRDYQMRTPQWTIGKNFDRTGSLGPELVTPDELPEGARGLRLRGLLNGKVMQEATTAHMIFDVAHTIALLSEALTLEVGDAIAMGTPGGVGFVRKPPVFLTPGDVFEVDVERLGTLRNRVVDQSELEKS